MSLCSLLLIGWPDSGSSLILFLLADQILVENKTRVISDGLLSSEKVACTVFLLGMLILEVWACSLLPISFIAAGLGVICSFWPLRFACRDSELCQLVRCNVSFFFIHEFCTYYSCERTYVSSESSGIGF
uniref:Putative conserved plasma membrane protein n=2 Tax=Ixodes ricinus TaxID=34613 RepID=A0A090XDM4_IXORI